MNGILRCVHFFGFNIPIHFFDIFHIDRHMINCSALHLCSLIFISLDHKRFQFQKCNLFVCFFIHRLKCNLKSQFLIKSNCFFNIICRNPDMLNPCCICFQIHLNVPSFLQPVQVPALQGSRLSSLHKGLPPLCSQIPEYVHRLLCSTDMLHRFPA